MGTSGASKGSDSRSPLVPTWLDEPDFTPLPGGDGAEVPDDGGNGSEQDDSDEAQRPDIPPAPQPERFRAARTNFSRFAGSGGSDGRALRRAVRDYVRSGTGGSRNAMRRMGASRAAASNALGVFRGIQRDGIQKTLLQLNLQDLAGSSPQDVFLGLTEVICRDGGSVDEAIAREAWLETVDKLDLFGIENLDALTVEQVNEVFLSFIAYAIETRLYQEIGVNGFRFSKDLDDIDGFDKQFRDYIERTVRDSFSSDLTQLSTMSDKKIREVVDKTFLETWNLLELLGDREG